MANQACEKQPVIAVDLMGGDRAPVTAVEGCVTVLKRGFRILALGSEEAVNMLLEKGPFDTLETLVCSQHILADEPPLQAIKGKPDSTICKGLDLVKEGRAGALVSGGSTGALVAGGVIILGRAPGVDKPCLGTVLPSANGRGVFFCDLGASSDVRPHTLVQFAVMAKTAAESVLGWSNPGVYLLNIGTEPEKGNAVMRRAFGMLQEAPVRFCGNVEARDVMSGMADVVVTDGFTGNVFLKTCEGVAGFQMGVLRREIESSILTKVSGLALRPAFRRAKELLDYSSYGGAMLLGLQGCVVKCHGASGPAAMARGIERAALFLERDVAATIVTVLSEMPEQTQSPRREGH